MSGASVTVSEPLVNDIEANRQLRFTANSGVLTFTAVGLSVPTSAPIAKGSPVYVDPHESVVRLTSFDSVAPGQLVQGDGVADGTTVKSVDTFTEVGNAAKGSNTLTVTLGGSGEHNATVGQTVVGEGIAAGTAITHVAGNVLTLSKPTSSVVGEFGESTATFTQGPFTVTASASAPFHATASSTGPFQLTGTAQGPFANTGMGQGPFSAVGSGLGPLELRATGQGPFEVQGTAPAPFTATGSARGPFLGTGTAAGPVSVAGVTLKKGPMTLSATAQGPFGVSSSAQGPFKGVGYADGPFQGKGTAQGPLSFAAVASCVPGASQLELEGDGFNEQGRSIEVGQLVSTLPPPGTTTSHIPAGARVTGVTPHIDAVTPEGITWTVKVDLSQPCQMSVSEGAMRVSPGDAPPRQPPPSPFPAPNRLRRHVSHRQNRHGPRRPPVVSWAACVRRQRVARGASF